MKRRLLYLAPILLIFVSIAADFIRPAQVSAATSPASYCQSQGFSQGGRNGVGFTYCVDGYGGRQANKSLSQSCPSSLGGTIDQQGSPVAICTDAWNAADVSSSSSTAPHAPSNPSSEAKKQCTNAEQGSTQSISACEIGFDGAKAGKSEDTLCAPLGSGSKTLGSSTDCQTGWDLAKGIAPPGAGSKSSPSSPSGPSSPGSSTPTCEASGFSLSWILCPIFDLVSGAANWIFQSLVQPFLITQPVSTSASDPSYQIWSNFRVYADIFLVLALLVTVFAESIGGGVIDAYTVRKVLPRLLAAAILINLSIYIVAFAVDVSNILGKGIGSLLTAPVSHCSSATGGNCWDFHLSNTDIASVFGVGLIGFLATSTAIAGLFAALFFGGFAVAATAITAAFFVMLPLLFAILAVFITLIFRKGLILFLVLISPVAFVLYALPNTERYFKRWWTLLLEALLVYPIVVAIFGVADILSITILEANSIAPSDLSGHVAFDVGRTVALITAFLLQFLPLLAIPFAFRIAGGTLSRVYDFAQTAGKQANKFADTRREQAKADYRAQSIAGRARTYQQLQDYGDRHQGPLGMGRRSSRWLARRAGGYNIEALASAGRAEVGKQLNDQINTGRDEEIRGLTVNKQWAEAQGELNAANGFNNGQMRRNRDGLMEYKTLGGAWVSEQAVDAGHSRWGRNQYAQQTALSYEMRKAITEEQSDNLAENYAHIAGTEAGGWGMHTDEASGAFKGAAFENQNQHLEYKYTDAATGAVNNETDFVDEIYERRGSYNMAQMNSRTIEQLKVAYQNAERSGNIDQQEKIAAITETFMHDVGMGGGLRPGDDGEAVPDTTPEGTVVPGRRQASTQGAAHVAERVRELATMTGVHIDPATIPPRPPGVPGQPQGTYTDPTHAPTDNRREQN